MRSSIVRSWAAKSARMLAATSWPSACILSDRWRGRPRLGVLIANAASSSCSNSMLSLVSTADSSAASGTPNAMVSG